MAKNIVKKPKVAKGEEVWVSFEKEQYEKLINNYVHLSVKAVNSNAEAGGVRLSQTLDLPYIAASTVVLEKVGLDYICAGGTIGRQAKQINSVLNNTYKDRFLAVPPQEVQWIKQFHAALDYAHIFSNNEVDCHVKQVLMHNGTEDVSLSPLHSAGLAMLLTHTEKELLEIKNESIRSKNTNLKKLDQEKVEQGKEQGKEKEKEREKYRLFRRAEMNFGGAKSQNAGLLVHAMKHPVFCLPPPESINHKRVFSIHFNGIKIENNILIDRFLFLTDSQRQKLNNGKILYMDDRSKIKNYLIKMVQDIKIRTKKAWVLLSENKDLLPVGKNNKTIFFSDSVANNTLQMGLFSDRSKSSEWRKELSHYLVEKIVKRQRAIKDLQGNFQKVGSGIDDDDEKIFYAIIKNEALK